MNGTTAPGGPGRAGPYRNACGGARASTQAEDGPARPGGGGPSSIGAPGQLGSAGHGAASGGAAQRTGPYDAAATGSDGHVVATGHGPYAFWVRYDGGVVFGAFYRPPPVVNHYPGAGCYNCGGWGGDLAGVEVETLVPEAVANANAAGAQAIVPGAGPIADAVYPGLPPGCDYRPTGGNA
ncbi:MAG: hypothetical protein P4M09_14830 [Devosia sp.]|nr:hypothetical protein [Devosia sp.]